MAADGATSWNGARLPDRAALAFAQRLGATKIGLMGNEQYVQ